MSDYPCVKVDDFLKNGVVDVVQGIREAITYANLHDIDTVLFDEGTYYLETYDTIETTSIAHDDGCGDIHEKDCHLVLNDLKNIRLKGTLHEDGTPATILAGFNSQISQTLLPSILWANGCENLTIENMAFTRQPETASAGIVRSIEDSTIEVEVFEGLPCYDGMAAYCMNRFDLAQKALLGASVTYGFGFDTRWNLVGDRRLTLTDAKIANLVQIGEGLSWHQSGKTDFLLFFGGCTNLTFKNIRIYNTNSFAILTENCNHITADQLVMKPAGNQLFTGSRDGWKIYRCTGNILLQNCHTEGVRMDGQNVHSNFMIVQEVVDDYSVRCTCKYAPIPLSVGSTVKFYDETNVYENELLAWRVEGQSSSESIQTEDDSAGMAVVGTMNHTTQYWLKLKRKVEDFVQNGCLMTPMCWEPTTYVCNDSTYHNIAGAGHLLRCGAVSIERCHYSNVMNAGILLGAEFDTHCEGGHAVDVKIRGCTFRHCGFKPRYGAFGCGGIAIKSQGFHGGYNQHILIEENEFRDCKTAIEIRDSWDVTVQNNTFYNVEQDCYIDEISGDIRIN